MLPTAIVLGPVVAVSWVVLGVVAAALLPGGRLLLLAGGAAAGSVAGACLFLSVGGIVCDAT